jgi:phosphorylcholine metabolism protein LicD
MRLVLTFVCVLSFVLLYSCRDKNKNAEGKILTAKEMQSVMWDILQADAFTQNFIKKDSTKKDQLENAALQKKIFELHKIKREDFYTSYNYYTAHPDEMRKILDSINAKAERGRNKMMEQRYGGTKAVE